MPSGTSPGVLARYPSPLRYPGGKGKIAPFIKAIIARNSLTGIDYVEPYAGGASVALSLLFNEYVSRVTINDLNRGVLAFWQAAVDDNEELCRLVRKTPLTIDEWRRQRATYHDPDAAGLTLGFATFYLNRTNRSGIIARGGVIGGNLQAGPYKMDARFDRDSLVARIRKVARFAPRITISGLDAVELLRSRGRRESLYYLDPPYYVKGSELYDNSYSPEDHSGIRAAVASLTDPWVVSYDDAPEIRSLYAGLPELRYGLDYSASGASTGREVMFFSPALAIPEVPSPQSVPKALLSS